MRKDERGWWRERRRHSLASKKGWREVKIGSHRFDRLTPTQKTIAQILYTKPKEKYKNELLTMIYKKEKAKHFKFLEYPPEAGGTKWKSEGYWRDENRKLLIEGNVQHEVQYADTLDDRRGKKLMKALKKYNEEEVHEDILYARTEPISESSL